MTRSRTFLVATAIAASAAVTFASGPAGAGGCPPFDPEAAADGQVAEESENFIGFDVFNRSGAGQTIFANLGAGAVVREYAEYFNTDDITRDIVVQAKLKGQASDYRVKISRLISGKDITSKVLGPNGRKFRGTFSGESTGQIRVRIKRLAGAPDTSELRVVFTGAFDQASTCGDTVKLKINVPV